MPTKVTELVERLEKATGPDRKLDAEIWDLVDRPEPDDPDRNLEIHDRIVMRLLAGGDDPECPRYTESIDAALTLVPEGCSWFLSSRRTGDHYAWVERWADHAEFDTTAATPAIALCAPALKSRPPC